MECSNLRAQIDRARRRNVRGEEYIPDLLLLPLISHKAVRNELVQKVKPYFVDELTTTIVASAQKVFAILVVIDRVELVKDLLERHLEDSNLPLPLRIQASLEESVAISFSRAQWMFLAPKFSRSMLSKQLAPECILPFTTEEKIDQGGFGTVYEISLDPQHQNLAGFPSRLVRKALERKDHSTESENLAILSHLKHQCIIELLGSYQHRDEYNLLFPLAEGGDLSSIFAREDAKPPFESDESFYLAIAGLSSALEHVHRFVDKNLNLNLIGCHYDFRPRNILISEGKLIIADFGLARFKEYDEDSKATLNKGADCYLAPERRNMGTRKRSKSGRSSDIWSFGCILAELMVFMTSGSEGVRQFKADREFNEDFVWYADFHQGSEPNPAVHSWLLRLGLTKSPQFRRLINIVQQMLSLSETQRPRAREVALDLRLIILWEVTASIDRLVGTIPGKSDSLDLFLQVQRFDAWKHGFGIVDYVSDSGVGDRHRISDEMFELTLGHLDNLRRCLRRSREGAQSLSEFEIRDFSLINDRLDGVLDTQQRERAQTFFSSSFLESKFTEYYQETHNDMSLIALSPAIQVMAALKTMTALAYEHSKQDQTNRQIPAHFIHNLQPFNGHSIGTMSGLTNDKTVLVEWRRYGEQANDVINQELFVHIECLTDLLSMEIPEGFCSLPCLGFYHDKSQTAFGMVYDLPPSLGSAAGNRLVTLEDFMMETRAISTQPTLDDKFSLAQILAIALLEFHMVGWLHKDLNSSNIVFCFRTRASISDILKQPYLIGFSHSRPDEENSFTDGPSRSGNDSFQHPKYRHAKRGYRQEYDYYSLGVVFLEIGCWKPLSRLTEDWNLSVDDFSERLLSSRVPLLGQYMGCRYRDAAKTCIVGDWKIGEIEDGETKVSLQDRFQKLVIDQLNQYT